MTKGAALHNFFASFGMDAYASTAVPDDVVMPYLIYTPAYGRWGDPAVSITVNLWFHTTSEAIPNAKVREIERRFGAGGVSLRCDEGLILLSTGSPWCIPIDDGANERKGRQLNVSALFNTI